VCKNIFRVGSLIELKSLQLEELATLTDQRSSLTDAARELAERYEDILSQHDNMIRRSASPAAQFIFKE